MIFFLFVVSSLASYGVDFSQYHSTSVLSCMVSGGYSFAIPRCFCSTGSVDSNCATNVANANAAGFSRTDAYFFPCYSCGNGAGQVSTFWSYVVSNQMNFKRLWFDIEGSWSSSYSTNQNFLLSLVNQARSIGIVSGIYSNQHYWTSFFGSYTFPYTSEFPIWYAHYDYDASFSDYYSSYSFGGWSTPSIKQYQGTTSYCGGSIDLNYSE